MGALVPVIVGGLLALAGGLLGAWVQGRREHAKWLRERRYEVHRDILATVDADAHQERNFRAWSDIGQPYEPHPSEVAELPPLVVLVSQAALLGPESLRESAADLQGAFSAWLSSGDDATFERARDTYIRTTQRLLKIRD